MSECPDTLTNRADSAMEMISEIDRMEARIAELEGALRPFAIEHAWGPKTRFIVQVSEIGSITGADMDAARRALSEGEG